MNYQRKILDLLIDKYENSKSYKEGTESTRRIMIDCEKLKWLDITDYHVNSEFLIAVRNLKKMNLIDFDWVRQGTVVRKIWLIIQNVDKAYDLLDRESKVSLIKKITTEIKNTYERVSTVWIKDYLEKQLSILNTQKKLIGIWKNNVDLIKDILSALIGIDGLNGETISIRSFSIKLYADSKHFQNNIKKFIVDIVKENEPELKDVEELSERDVLHHVGIVMMSEIFEFCGNLVLYFRNGEVDFSFIESGACISSNCINEIEFAEIRDTERIIFIENKTNYSEYCLKNRNHNELVIYHGGFYSPQKGKFFKIINNAAINIPIYFWADIDCGGFKMFVRLKNNIIGDLLPMNMDAENFRAHSDKLLSRSKEYLYNLLWLKKDVDYDLFGDVIDLILEYGGTLEQECFLLDNNMMLV